MIEGETVVLSASFKNNISSTDYRGSGFSVYIYDEGNVTGMFALDILQSPSMYDNTQSVIYSVGGGGDRGYPP